MVFNTKSSLFDKRIEVKRGMSRKLCAQGLRLYWNRNDSSTPTSLGRPRSPFKSSSQKQKLHSKVAPTASSRRLEPR